MKSDVADLINATRAAGRRAMAVTIDLPNLDQARASIARARGEMGRIDVLVNNIGIGPENLAEDVTEADFDMTVDVNLKGTFFVSQAVAKLMKAQGGGRIINISSQAGSVVLKGEAIYCMSKAAINHLTRCLAYEWAPYHINVNSVSPTFIHTDGTAPALSDPAFHARVLDHIPLGRIGETVGCCRRCCVSCLARIGADNRHESPGGWRLVDRRLGRRKVLRARNARLLLAQVAAHEFKRVRQKLLHGGASLGSVTRHDRVEHFLVQRQEYCERLARNLVTNIETNGNQVTHLQKQSILARRKNRAMKAQVGIYS